MNLKNETTLKVKEYFKDKPVLKAYVFGSYARSEMQANSDIDLLVELDYSKTIGLGFVKMQLELQKLLSRNVDLLTEKSVSRYIKPNIENDKVLIYEK